MNQNQVSTQLIINPTDPTVKLNSILDPKLVWNQEGHKDFSQIGSSWIATFSSFHTAKDAEKNILLSIAENQLELISLEIFSHSKFSMRSAFINEATILDNYGLIDATSTLSQLRMDLYSNSRHFVKEADIVDLRIRKRGKLD